MSRLIPALLAAAAVAAPAAAQQAQQTVVVTPASTSWGATDVAGGASAAITATYPRGGNGSPQNGSIQFTSPGGNAAKAAYTTYFAYPGTISLASLTSFSFDWYRASSSTTTNYFAPSIHLIVTDAANANRYSELNWEYVYNNAGAAPTNAWQTVNLVGQNFYRRQGGTTNTSCGTVEQNGGAQLNQTLAQWAASQCYGDARIAGITVVIGSGWGAGTVDMAADNVVFGATGFNNGTAIRYNFEPAAVVPEPATVALVGAGLLALGAAARRRRSS